MPNQLLPSEVIATTLIQPAVIHTQLEPSPIRHTVLQTGQGPAGPAGVQGKIGDPGPQGEVGIDLHYVHLQDLPSSAWEVTHSMGKYPSVTIVDSAGDTVEGEVKYNGLDSLTITFSAPFGGKAYFN